MTGGQEVDARAKARPGNVGRAPDIMSPLNDPAVIIKASRQPDAHR